MRSTRAAACALLAALISLVVLGLVVEPAGASPNQMIVLHVTSSPHEPLASTVPTDLSSCPHTVARRAVTARALPPPAELAEVPTASCAAAQRWQVGPRLGQSATFVVSWLRRSGCRPMALGVLRC